MMYQANKDRYENMEYRKCGNSGLHLPLVSLGMWHNFGTNDDFNNMKEMCFAAFDEGITHFDLANNYGPVPGSAEENFGKIMAVDLAAHRDELIISTKAGYDMWDGPYGSWGSRKHLISSLDQSLKRLALDYVDIFYHHRPDENTPLEETMQALADIVKSGKALYIGISNYNNEQTTQATKILKELGCPLLINQRRYSILDRTIEQDGLKEHTPEHGIGIIAFSPLAQGLLTDKYLNGIPEDSRIRRDGRFLREEHLTDDLLSRLQALNNLAMQRGQSLAKMALAWVLRDLEVTSVLIGASRPDQIRENLVTIADMSFTQQELRIIEEHTLPEGD
ncbi:MAG: L-glyceraldehyde 3-phosphate reductase [Clostridiaceae bacterium]|nr:L-glyceraldehyde 3-phosphate reductase [Clostridiaceae bacterium]